MEAAYVVRREMTVEGETNATLLPATSEVGQGLKTTAVRRPTYPLRCPVPLKTTISKVASVPSPVGKGRRRQTADAAASGQRTSEAGDVKMTEGMVLAAAR